MIYVLKRVILVMVMLKLQGGSFGGMNHGQDCGQWPLKNSYMIYNSGCLMRSVDNLRLVI